MHSVCVCHAADEKKKNNNNSNWLLSSSDHLQQNYCNCWVTSKRWILMQSKELGPQTKLNDCNFIKPGNILRRNDTLYKKQVYDYYCKSWNFLHTVLTLCQRRFWEVIHWCRQYHNLEGRRSSWPGSTCVYLAWQPISPYRTLTWCTRTFLSAPTPHQPRASVHHVHMHEVVYIYRYIRYIVHDRWGSYFIQQVGYI